MSASSSGDLQRTVDVLRGRYGKIDWWPGDRDEVLIGAILTRQTRWENIVRALSELRSRNLSSIAALGSAGIREPRSPALKSLFGPVPACDNHVYRETHAHIVEYAEVFRVNKRCDTCMLANSNG